jgi:hypothetical protein
MRKRSAVLLRRPQGVDAVLEAITGCGISTAIDNANRLVQYAAVLST